MSRTNTEEELAALFAEQSVNVEGLDDPVLICPICLGVWGEAQLFVERKGQKVLTREHAPQQQSGHPDLRCITCFPCNTGRGFEKRFSENPSDSRAAQLVDLTAGYLIAFAQTGYRYILDTALKQTRWRITHEQAANTCGRFTRSNDDHASPRSRHVIVPQARGEDLVLLVHLEDGHCRDVDLAGSEHYVILPRPGGSPLTHWKQEHGEVFEILTSVAEEACWESNRLPRSWDRCSTPDHKHPVSKETWCFRPATNRLWEWEALGTMIHAPGATHGRLLL